MTTSEERIGRTEGVLEQINERSGNLEAQNLRILEQKADKSEVRLLFVTTVTLLVAIIGILGRYWPRFNSEPGAFTEDMTSPGPSLASLKLLAAS